MSERRSVELRNEHSGEDFRHLWAYVDDAGDLQIHAQDLGPGTALVSGSGSYEYIKEVAAEDIPRVITLLGGEAGEDVLDVMLRYAGDRSYELEKLLRESDIPVELFIYD